MLRERQRKDIRFARRFYVGPKGPAHKDKAVAGELPFALLRANRRYKNPTATFTAQRVRQPVNIPEHLPKILSPCRRGRVYAFSGVSHLNSCCAGTQGGSLIPIEFP